MTLTHQDSYCSVCGDGPFARLSLHVARSHPAWLATAKDGGKPYSQVACDHCGEILGITRHGPPFAIYVCPKVECLEAEAKRSRPEPLDSGLLADWFRGLPVVVLAELYGLTERRVWAMLRAAGVFK